MADTKSTSPIKPSDTMNQHKRLAMFGDIDTPKEAGASGKGSTKEGSAGSGNTKPNY